MSLLVPVLAGPAPAGGELIFQITFSTVQPAMDDAQRDAVRAAALRRYGGAPAETQAAPIAPTAPQQPQDLAEDPSPEDASEAQQLALALQMSLQDGDGSCAADAGVNKVVGFLSD